jgi:hypothetical protein
MTPLDWLKWVSRGGGRGLRRLSDIMDPPPAQSPVNRFLSAYPPGHYYSPIPDLAEIEAHRQDYFRDGRENLPGISLDVGTQLSTVRELARYASDYHPAVDHSQAAITSERYFLANGFFESLDAFALYGMLRWLSPRQIFEVGSGFSSALILDVSARFLATRPSLTFVDPEPQRLMNLLRPQDLQVATVIAGPVQQLDPSRFDQLGPNDILFVDSSHVSKIGSDVNFLVFEVLPRLASGVVVHIHDIFWPFEYPEPWFAAGRCWNELYLVRALLSAGMRYEMLHFNSYLFQCHRAALGVYPSWATSSSGASLWLRVR